MVGGGVRTQGGEGGVRTQGGEGGVRTQGLGACDRRKRFGPWGLGRKGRMHAGITLQYPKPWITLENPTHT